MLSLKSLNASYGASQVIWSVDLDVQTGEAVAILGRNGVGKTTLLRTIMGLHPVYGSGNILLDDVDITLLQAHERARMGIAYVPQGRGIFPHLTVWENLLMGRAALNSKAKSGHGENLIPDYVFQLFPKLKDLLERKGGNLSGGQQQQLAIARVLVTQPRLLMLDEPTEGLQPSIVMEIEKALSDIRKELHVTVLLVEQYLEFAWEFAERYYVMDRGRVVGQGQTRTGDQTAISHLMGV